MTNAPSHLTPELDAAVWERLTTGSSLDDLELPEIDGRIDLRGLAAPEPVVVSTSETAETRVTRLGGLLTIRRGHWKGLDFSGSQLKSLRFFDTTIEDCRFDKANCSDWRMWGTSIVRTSFVSADLRGASLGGVDEGKRNFFREVDFSKADLRGSAHGVAEMVGCRFFQAKLRKVDFQGTVLVNCVFAGLLDEVCFSDHEFRRRQFPPNEMRGVDFRDAKFRFVEFRNLDLDDVIWPKDEGHYVVQDFPSMLDRALAEWSNREDLRSRRLATFFSGVRKWLGPKQRVGVISRDDLRYIGGEAAVSDFLQLIGH
jgi:Pentapeptide repeats (8 copies)